MVELKRIQPGTVAYVAGKGPYSQLPGAIGRLLSWVRGNGYTPQGPISGVYFNSPVDVPPEELLWEVRCPLPGAVPAQSPDKAGVGVRGVDGAEMAFVLHRGPYSEVGTAYAALMEWMARHDSEPCGPAEEVYLNNPASVSEDELLTEVRFPVKMKKGLHRLG